MRRSRQLFQALTAAMSPQWTGSATATSSWVRSSLLATTRAVDETRHPWFVVGGERRQPQQYRRGLSVRGGGEGVDDAQDGPPPYETRANPAPGSPFHYAFPVHDLELAKDFYGRVLGCEEGRSSAKWQDYSLHGHQIVAHWVGDDYRCQDYYNPVDGDEVPVPHTGLALTVEQFSDLAERVRAAGVEFIIEPHLRFEGMPGEQYTMFFKDPSGEGTSCFCDDCVCVIAAHFLHLNGKGNNLEFKAMKVPENLFAKYNVADK